MNMMRSRTCGSSFVACFVVQSGGYRLTVCPLPIERQKTLLPTWTGKQQYIIVPLISVWIPPQLIFASAITARRSTASTLTQTHCAHLFTLIDREPTGIGCLIGLICIRGSPEQHTEVVAERVVRRVPAEDDERI